MSYVIQNFNNYNKKINLTPRLKSIWLFYNLNRIIFFFKMKIVLSFIWNRSLDYQIIYTLFIYYFFSKQFSKILNILNFKLVGTYDNKIIRTSTIFFLKNFLLIKNLNNFKKMTSLINYINDAYIYNQYFLSIKIITVDLSKTFYKKMFFYHLLAWGSLWYQRPVELKFYLNFIITIPTLNFFKFYNNYFLKTYNY